MKPLWAIEFHPLDGKGKAWVHHDTIAFTRKAALLLLYHEATENWRKELDKRRRKGLIKIVRVVVTVVEGGRNE